MTLSLNEVESTAWKAGRGAGLAWGLAEEIGQAARWMADRGLAWAEPVVACLTEVEKKRGHVEPPVLVEGIWQPAAGSAPLSPVLCGPLISDLASQLTKDGGILRFGAMAQPILLVPFVARAAEALDAELALSCCGADWLCTGSGTYRSTPEPPRSTRNVVVRAGKADRERFAGSRLVPGAERRPVAPELLHRLDNWVRLTYVPASAESRLMGAGAGLTDND